MKSARSERKHNITFTTTEAGRICGVSQQTVIKWIDSGRLQGYHVPSSRARRVTRDSLLRFMRENNIPTSALDCSEKLKVLVVDDEEIVAEMIELEFENDQNVEVKKVGRGFDAGVVMDYKPDVVVLDIMLPDMDGRTVCELIRAGDGGGDMRIIGVSGYANSLNVEEMLARGFDDFIPKPFSPRQIRNAVLACDRSAAM